MGNENPTVSAEDGGDRHRWERAGGSARALNPGDVLGRYRIEGILGAGGMGVVYRARQDRPAREVALKVIGPGLASARSIRRFELEAEVLGRLQHPGIAQIYEAGTADAGFGPTPFFAMELVRGVSLTRYACDNGLSTRQRLELFALVCDAVQHAHSKGVIHRDLKPGNILVGEDGRAKVLDFGVARLTEHDVQMTTVQTDIGQLIGTVPYMSPEQVAGDAAELDTRSDVYALGVVLYELLTGRLPYDLSKKVVHEAARIIREEDPTRLSSVDRSLRGDIETISLKALEKEKERRYQSASDLASDIARYLRDEPISARPASAAYQLRKFARRNRALVGGVVATIVALAAGLVGTAAFAVRAEEQRREAESARTLAEEQRAAAEKHAKETEQVAKFQAAMLSGVDVAEAGAGLARDALQRYVQALAARHVPEDERQARSEQFRAALVLANPTDLAEGFIDRAILSPAGRAIGDQFGPQPLVRATLLEHLAASYESIASFEMAASNQRECLSIRERAFGPAHLLTLGSKARLGHLLVSVSPFPYNEAEVLCREALEGLKALAGEESEDTLIAMEYYGNVLFAQGRMADAEPILLRAYEIARDRFGAEYPNTLSLLNSLGSLRREQGKLKEAEAAWREALEIRRRVSPPDDPTLITSLNNMGIILQDQGLYSEAEAHYLEALEMSRRAHGDDNPGTALLIGNLGYFYNEAGDLEKAEQFNREALEWNRRNLGDDHGATLTYLNNLAFTLYRRGDLPCATGLFREGYERSRRVLGEDHPQTLGAMSNLGALLRAQGLLEEAEPILRDALAVRIRLLGPGHADTLVSQNNLAALLRDGGRFAEAASLVIEAVETCLAGFEASHPVCKRLMENLVQCYKAWHAAEPGAGHEAKAAEWQAKLDAMSVPAQEQQEKTDP